MRERTTWNRDQIKQAAMQRRADPYTMNQDHKQPAADAYVTGTPSDFAEDVTAPNRWEEEYKGGQVDRNEIGMPEMRSDTFKTASHELLLKKADLTVKVARLMLPKTASETAVEDQAYGLMYMPDSELISTFDRLAAEDGEDKKSEEKPEDKPEEQATQKQAAMDQQALDAVNALQAGDPLKAQAMIQAMVQQACKQANQGQPPAQGQPGQEQQQQAQAQPQQPQQQISQGPDQTQLAQQLAQLVQQAVQQGQGQPQAPAPQQQQAQVQPQAPAPQMAAQPDQPVMGDDQLLDTMLMDEPMIDDGGIQMDTPLMDTGDVVLGPEDDVLRDLFANQEAQDAADAQQQDQGQQQGQKQAMTRTASTRTVGTRPTHGVSRVGGSAAAPGRGAEIDKLTALWPSAPDVGSAFGMK